MELLLDFDFYLQLITSQPIIDWTPVRRDYLLSNSPIFADLLFVAKPHTEEKLLKVCLNLNCNSSLLRSVTDLSLTLDLVP
jgi:hypothetical protein